MSDCRTVRLCYFQATGSPLPIGVALVACQSNLTSGLSTGGNAPSRRVLSTRDHPWNHPLRLTWRYSSCRAHPPNPLDRPVRPRLTPCRRLTTQAPGKGLGTFPAHHAGPPRSRQPAHRAPADSLGPQECFPLATGGLGSACRVWPTRPTRTLASNHKWRGHAATKRSTAISAARPRACQRS